MSKGSAKFARNWLEAKEHMINEYVPKSQGIASSLIESKDKTVENFKIAMSGTKFEKNLLKYKDNALMGEAYRDGMNAKTSFTESELTKVSSFIEYQRIRMTESINYLYNNSLTENPIFAYPSYTNNKKRYDMECRIGMNKFSLPLWSQGKQFVPVPFDWDDYMVNDFAWIPAFDI